MVRLERRADAAPGRRPSKGHLFFLRATDGVRPWEPPRPGLEAAAVVLGQSGAPLLGDALSPPSPPPHNGVPRRGGRAPLDSALER
ncbi:hypothetical protein HPB50_018513 [Hyalomma asiaticum]|uniref:Uncharacterized protein n=1 Tax=Hyalomma asiaticum TaxID=266040 RepID=A0ACB7TJY0_HYAAI|nr:hypothetical protein HPB50_018513 [Hyalomma asiaticum]